MTEQIFPSAEPGETRTCEKHGDYQSSVVEVFGSRMETKCPQCVAEDTDERDRAFQREIAEQARAAKQREAERIVRKAGIPERFRGKGFDDFRAKGPAMTEVLRLCRAYADHFDDLAKHGTSMIFSGTSGTGKTHLACAIGNQLMRDRKTVLFVNAYDMLMTVKNTYDRDSQDRESDVIREFTRPDLLMIDEVDVGLASDTDRRILFAILNGRYEKMRPQILLSNLGTEGPAKTIQDVLGSRMFDRMLEGRGKILKFEGRSFRTADER